ncbi:uncharacterized protein PADG_02066 [Paracoccidioides brasiliensis Pb18]|uniref:Uncharacterized protein n=1 Tax=Paracoccidioides brasiliensis (strain Pb18) TaxID=502780 RepID=C1G550_PARBD|nr:uncharacterized protein PADG_02066 [Paracoccidioides brasiliensis Pb18]EEH45916.2 hypothetical protein PADG_02066 [Paracoccidioides brasiliensis Pb18]
MPPVKRTKKSSSPKRRHLQSEPEAIQKSKSKDEDNKVQKREDDTPPPPPPPSSSPPSPAAAAPPIPSRGYGQGYNALKSFKGRLYTGMSIGASHTWTYQPGTWHETKQEPDLWKIDYTATKRRAGKRPAPRGSGAPVGTEYHWLIVAHQYVKKLDANTYETRMVGSKYKLAHKGVGVGGWSVGSVREQREREVELLEDAGRRVRGLPPVSKGERVREEMRERGQQRVDEFFWGGKKVGLKRMREGGEGDGDGDRGGAEEVVMGDVDEEG